MSRGSRQGRRELSELLARKVREPRVAGVVITEVRVTSDLSLARVYFRVPRDGPGFDEAEEGLNSAAGFLRRELGQLLRIRRTPELRFLPDETIDSAMRIEEILKGLGQGSTDSSATSDPEPAEGE